MMVLGYQLMLFLLATAAILFVARSLVAVDSLLPAHLKAAIFVFWLVYLIAGISLVAGAAGLLNPLYVSLLATVFALAFYKYMGPAEPLSVHAHRLFNRTGDIISNNPVPSAVGMMLILFMLARHLVYIWFLPPHVYDVLTYHFPKIADWIQAERLVALATPVVRSYWPANMELVQAWFALFFHHDVIIELAGVPFWILGGLSVFSIARSLGVTGGPSFWAMIAFWSTPVILQNAVSGKNDIAIAAIYLFSIAILLEWRNRKLWSWSIILPLICGLLFAVGIKPTILFMGPPLLIFMFFQVPWKLYRERSQDICLPKLTICVVLLLGLILGFYWYIRNAILFGNPFHPTDFRLFGVLIAGDGQGSGQQGGFSYHSALESIRSLWVQGRLWDERGQYSPDVTFISGWGWFVFSIGLPSLVLAQSNRAFRGITLLFITSALLLFCFVDYDPWNMRFLQWFPALFCIAFAVVLHQHGSPAWKSAVLFLSTACIILNLVGTMNNGWFSRDDWRHFMAMSWRDRAVSTGFESFWRNVPPGETLAYFMAPNDPVYVLRGPGFQQKVEMLRVDASDRDFARAMDRQNLRYLAYAAADRDFEWRGPFNAQIERGYFVVIRHGLYLRSHENNDP